MRVTIVTQFSPSGKRKPPGDEVPDGATAEVEFGRLQEDCNSLTRKSKGKKKKIRAMIDTVGRGGYNEGKGKRFSQRVSPCRVSPWKSRRVRPTRRLLSYFLINSIRRMTRPMNVRVTMMD